MSTFSDTHTFSKKIFQLIVFLQVIKKCMIFELISS